MSMLVFGSLNIDHVYQLDHLVQPGETLAAVSYQKNAGGKGLNQAIALAKAGRQTSLAGAIGQDGLFLRDILQEFQVDGAHLQVLSAPTGHAIIQVDSQGQNNIIIHGGANHCLTQTMIHSVLSHFQAGDYVLMQNETNLGPEIIRAAAARGMHVILNPSPFSPALLSWPMELVEWFILNEIEGEALSGKNQPHAMLDALLSRYPSAHILLTLGKEGALYADRFNRYRQSAYAVQAIDTTAAGDTFTGYFFHSLLNGKSIPLCLQTAAAAAALAVSRPGAAKSIPDPKEVEAFFAATE